MLSCTLIAVALRVLFRMYERESRKSEWATVESHIVDVSSRIFVDFTPETKDVWAAPVVLVLREILHLGDERVCYIMSISTYFHRSILL